MSRLDDFMKIISGRFDNKEQYEYYKRMGIYTFPYAEHVNTVLNDRIKNLPDGFEGYFVLEESYYTVEDNTNLNPHILLFRESDEGILMTSYVIPDGYEKKTLSYDKIESLDFLNLKVSERFAPTLFRLKDGVWKGSSDSMFSSSLKFKLREKFSEERLEVSESMELNGKKTFGYDAPIIYKRIEK